MMNHKRSFTIFFLFFPLFFLGTLQPLFSQQASDTRCQRNSRFEYDNIDQDGDGLKDWEEDRNTNCRLDPGESVPYLPFLGYSSQYPDRPVPPRPSGDDESPEVRAWRQALNDMAKDTDGDGIWDTYEYFRDDAAHAAYVAAVGPIAAEEQSVEGIDSQKDAWFRCPEAANPFNCDGREGGNANDRDADNDGIPDKFENCAVDSMNLGNVAGVEGTPESQPLEGCLSEARVQFFGGMTAYLWQETDPYSDDTDGDGISEGRPSPGRDLCPNADGGQILEGADGTRDGSEEEAAAADFSCVRTLCKASLFAGLPDFWDTDVDGRPDKVEDVNGNCIVNFAEASEESSPFDYDTDADGLSDREDPCPLDDDLNCDYVCKPGGFDGDKKWGKHVGQGTLVDRNNFDYDGDDLTDLTEDDDGDCEYTGPSDRRGARGRSLVSKETDWKDADTDHDGYVYDDEGYPTGDPLFDPLLGTQQAVGTDQYDRCPHLNPDDDSSNDWPHCLRHYCNKPDLGRLNYTITDENDADGDGLKDLEEDRNGNCRYDAPRTQYGETVARETNWLEPNSDGDSVPDFFDACGSQPEIWQGQDYDGDGIPNGLEDVDHDCIFYPADPFETDPYSAEVDADGMEDRDRSCRNPDLHVAWLELDSDGDGLKNGEEDANGDCDFDEWETDPYDTDTDGDTVLDGDDTCRHPKLHERWAALDRDLDGLPNGDEDANGNCQIDQFETNPFSADTDGDGFQDRDDSCGHSKLHEQWKTRDADGDTLKNGDEDADGNCQVGPFESDPFRADTDGDGRNDFEDSCPFSSDVSCLTRCEPTSSFSDASRDSDGDGLKDVEEDSDKDCLFFGIVVQNGHGPTEPDPFDTSIYARDSDGDGLSDRVDGCQKLPDVGGVLPSITVPVSLEEEVCAREQCLAAIGRDPGGLKDSDRDGLPDIIEDPDFDCIISAESETDRFNSDTDGDGLPDGVEDSNKNGIVDMDAEKGTGETNPRDADTDDDGIPDGVEDANQNGRYDYGELNPRLADTDGDKILDSFEDRNKNGLWDGGQLQATGPCRLTDAEGKRVLDETGSPLVPETSGYLKDSDLDGIEDGIEDGNMNGVFTNIGSRFKSTLMPEGKAISDTDVIEFGESHPCDNDTDGDTLFDGQEDLNGDGVLNWKEGETSPISPHTFGEPDTSRLQRKLGMSGCTLIPEK